MKYLSLTIYCVCLLLSCSKERSSSYFADHLNYCCIDITYYNKAPDVYYDFFLISSEDNGVYPTDVKPYLDSIACSIRLDSIYGTTAYFLSFYKSSDISNVFNLSTDKYLFEDYAIREDRLATYTWRNEKFFNSVFNSYLWRTPYYRLGSLGAEPLDH